MPVYNVEVSHTVKYITCIVAPYRQLAEKTMRVLMDNDLVDVADASENYIILYETNEMPEYASIDFVSEGDDGHQEIS